MQTYTHFIAKIKNNLQNPILPGLESQIKMAPITRLKEISRRFESSTENKELLKNNPPRKSAVLILFYPIDGKPHIAMIKRAADNSVHSRQVSFPGGKIEESDDSLIHTALREANEEVGINSIDVHIIGGLTKLYIPPSNFDVYPIVGFTDSRPEFITNEEVEHLIEVDFESLSNPQTRTKKTIPLVEGKEAEVPCYYIQNEIIWGATAMIISELLDIVGSE